jgi:hypothetical protein
MKLSMKSTLAALALTTIGAGAAYAEDTCQWGNACTMATDWASGGGYVEGGGSGTAWGGNTFNGGEVVERGTIARSETGFTGSFRFAADECGTCEQDNVAVFGQGFSTQLSGSFIETNGGYAEASSDTYGGAGGSGYAWRGMGDN